MCVGTGATLIAIGFAAKGKRTKTIKRLIMLHRLTACLSMLLLLSACESYDFKVNDTVVYSPHPLFNDFDVPDEALRDCLEQTIMDGKIATAGQLTTFSCSHAGVKELTGLSSFPGLKTLKLSSNNIRNLVEISSIVSLEELYLDNNKVIDPVPLYQLSSLNTLDLSGNPDLQCPDKAGLQHIEIVVLPSHCL